MQLVILLLTAAVLQLERMVVAENTTVAVGLNLTGPSPNAGLQAAQGNLSTALPGLAVLQDGATGDCAEPSRVNLQRELAMRADLVITGNNMTSAASRATTLRPATDLIVDADAQTTDGSTTLLVIVQCVHKGVLACRRNVVDKNAVTDTLGKCVIAVKVPAQRYAASSSPDGLPPCSVTPGFRYMMLLSSRPQARCDGGYSTAYSRIVDAIKPHLGSNQCSPYPQWPSQNTNYTGDGVAGDLARRCPGSVTSPTPVKCGVQDGCQGQACPVGAAVSCVTKMCEGRYMVDAFVSPVESCVPVFVSQVSGLPVQACNVTSNQLMRQASQAKRRTGLATGKVLPNQSEVDPKTGRPKLLPPDQLFGGRFEGDSAADLQSGVENVPADESQAGSNSSSDSSSGATGP
eukprot:gene5309-5544_t